MSVKLYLGDCLELMRDLPDASVDMILCDLPYGITACKWDAIIPFEPLWAAYKRVIKPAGAIVLTASQPFTSALVMSNPSWFRTEWIWEKGNATGHLNAKKQPLRAHESVLVFSSAQTVYNPQMTHGHARKVANRVNRSDKQSDCYGKQNGVTNYDSTSRYPRSVVKFSSDKQRMNLHPTQKPVALVEYLIRTYTNEGDTVLDNCMGSGTTGVAALRLGRSFIGMENDPTHFAVAESRIYSEDDEL